MTPIAIDIMVASFFLIGLVLLLTVLIVAFRAFLIPDRAISIDVNGVRNVAARTGQKLLGALNDGEVLVPSACAGAGTCGLCRVKVSRGGAEPLPVEASRLTRAELMNGVRLACQFTLRNDVSVEVPHDLLSAESFSLTVSSTTQLTPLIREIVLQLPEGTRPDIFAGSFVQITTPPFSLTYLQIDVPGEFDDHWKKLRNLSVSSPVEVTRAYSISNRPEDTAAGRLVLNVRLALPPPSRPDISPGIVSSWLFGLKEGAQVQVSGPYGSFRAQDTDREMVFIGGGVGMAPLRAMIFEQLQRLKSTRRISFWYGARSKADLFYDSEFDALARDHPNFTWMVALSDAASGPKSGTERESGWSGAKGFVHEVAFERYLRDHPAPETCEFYLCGPPMMIRAVMAMLDDLGVEKENIFNDDFGV